MSERRVDDASLLLGEDVSPGLRAAEVAERDPLRSNQQGSCSKVRWP